MNAITTSFINQLEAIEKSADKIILNLFSLLMLKQQKQLSDILQTVLTSGSMFLKIDKEGLSYPLLVLNLTDKLKVLNVIENIIAEGNGN